MLKVRPALVREELALREHRILTCLSDLLRAPVLHGLWILQRRSVHIYHPDHFQLLVKTALRVFQGQLF